MVRLKGQAAGDILVAIWSHAERMERERNEARRLAEQWRNIDHQRRSITKLRKLPWEISENAEPIRAGVDSEST